MRYVAPTTPRPSGKTGKYIEKKYPDVINDTWVFKPEQKPPQEIPSDNRWLYYPPLWTKNINDITSDEIWATQESIWVQNEVFRQIKATNDSLAAFELVEPRAKDGKSARFRNFYWEVELTMAKGGVNVKLKNLRPNWQPVENLHFVARFKDANDKNAKTGVPVLIPPLKSSGWQGYPVGPAGGGNDVFPNEKSGRQDRCQVHRKRLTSISLVFTPWTRC